MTHGVWSDRDCVVIVTMLNSIPSTALEGFFATAILSSYIPFKLGQEVFVLFFLSGQTGSSVHKGLKQIYIYSFML